MKKTEITPEIVCEVYLSVEDQIIDTEKEYEISNENLISKLKTDDEWFDLIIKFNVKKSSRIITEAYGVQNTAISWIESLSIESIDLFDQEGEEVDFICEYIQCENYTINRSK